MIEIRTADGVMPAYLAEPSPDAPPRRPIVLLHEGFGLNEHIISIADRLAQRGHRTVAPNLYYRMTDEAASYDDVPRALELVGSVTVDDLSADVAAAAEHLSPRQPVLALGFCFGGAAAYVAAARVPRLARAVAFYPVSILQYWDDAGPPLCPLLAMFGDQDEFLGEREMRWLESLHDDPAALVRIEILPDAGHAFVNDSRPEFYRPEQAARAWADALDFLDKDHPNQAAQGETDGSERNRADRQ